VSWLPRSRAAEVTRTRRVPGPCPGLRVGPGARRYRWPAGRRPSGAGADWCYGRQESAVLAPGTATSTGPKGCPPAADPGTRQGLYGCDVPPGARPWF